MVISVGKSYDFKTSLRIGARASNAVQERFILSGWAVENVEGLPLFRALDIDFIVGAPGCGVFTVEVKGDQSAHATKNIYIETSSNDSTGSLGCLIYSRADYIAYYVMGAGACLMIPRKELQSWIARRIDDFTSVTIQAHATAKSSGTPVPIRVIKAEVPGCYLLYDLPVLGVE